MLVVADTSLLVSLILIGQLHVLERLYPDYCVPNAVFSELKKFEEIKFFASELNLIQERVKLLKKEINISDRTLGAGEIESMALCLELKAEFLLIDDKEARYFAEKLNLKCFGTLSLLLKAKEEGFIKMIKPLLIELQRNKRYYSNKVIEKILFMANELQP